MLLGLGVFSTLGIWNRKAFALDRHYARLCSDVAALELTCPFTEAEISSALIQLIEAEDITRGIARLTLTARGDGRWNREPGCDLSILAQGTVDRDHALKIGWSPFRIEARRPAAGVKTTSYADFWLAWREAQRRGLDETILCNSAGALCEASRANLLWTQDESLFTPSLDCGCLPGIGRALVLEWARADGFPVREASFAPSELENADTILLTSAAGGVRRAVLESSQMESPLIKNPHLNENAAPDALAEHLMRRWNDAVQH